MAMVVTTAAPATTAALAAMVATHKAAAFT